MCEELREISCHLIVHIHVALIRNKVLISESKRTQAIKTYAQIANTQLMQNV